MYLTLERYLLKRTSIKIRQLDHKTVEELRTLLIREVPELYLTPLPPAKETHSFFEYVDGLIQYLLSIKSTNVVCLGYIKSPPNNELGNVNPRTNFSVNHLKSNSLWNVLYNMVGASQFSHLILNTKCFMKVDGTMVQLFGPISIPRSHFLELPVSKRRSFQRTRPYHTVTFILPKEKSKIMESITGVFYQAKYPKKLEGLSKLVDKIMRNDTKCNYKLIFSHYNTRTEVDYENPLDNSMDLKVVIGVVLKIVAALFPAETWGCQRNKTRIIKKIVRFLKMKEFETLSLGFFLDSIEISSISWLSKLKAISSKQDWDKRVTIFKKFIKWVFEVVLNNILKSFWYITDCPSLSERGNVFYFCHHHWNKISQRWLKEYSETDLVEVSRDMFEAQTLNEKFNYGFMKLIPKPRDLRLICVPGKTPWNQLSEAKKDSNTFEHYTFLEEVITPTRKILNHLMFQKYGGNMSRPLCFSKSDVAIAIQGYKKSLLLKFGSLPPLYVMQFDMEHCFDQLSHEKVFESLNDLLGSESPEKAYFVRQIAEFTKIGRLKKMKAIIKEDKHVTEFNLLKGLCERGDFKGSDTVLVDRNKTVRLTKGDIYSVLAGFVKNCRIVVNENCYTRKRGVFQGFPLSSTICDLVYNRLTKILSDLLDSETMILRVVDDFLLISTSPDVFTETTKIIKSPLFTDCGVYVNESKTKLQCTSGENYEKGNFVNFLGMRIETDTLKITRNLSIPSFSLHSITSAAKLFNYLKCSFNGLTPAYSLTFEFNSSFEVLENLEKAQASILKVFKENYVALLNNGVDIDKSSVKVFLAEILELTMLKLKELKEDTLRYTLHQKAHDEIQYDDTYTTDMAISQFQSLICLYFDEIPGLEEIIQWGESLGSLLNETK